MEESARVHRNRWLRRIAGQDESAVSGSSRREDNLSAPSGSARVTASDEDDAVPDAIRRDGDVVQIQVGLSDVADFRRPDESNGGSARVELRGRQGVCLRRVVIRGLRNRDARRPGGRGGEHLHEEVLADGVVGFDLQGVRGTPGSNARPIVSHLHLVVGQLLQFGRDPEPSGTRGPRRGGRRLECVRAPLRLHARAGVVVTAIVCLRPVCAGVRALLRRVEPSGYRSVRRVSRRRKGDGTGPRGVRTRRGLNEGGGDAPR